ncbi:hypothetical protein C8F04DRAFT_1276804 [Mycena alexandri]|uniref:Uncharacterized protein n=1 Tax=Mycena alexandri TaxID=1745969 RepID=A0AAD6S2A6_9AGAR|nr:hypothetical protein C8F04DRAFT_1276804 [Mycena alexandri]
MVHGGVRCCSGPSSQVHSSIARPELRYSQTLSACPQTRVLHRRGTRTDAEHHPRRTPQPAVNTTKNRHHARPRILCTTGCSTRPETQTSARIAPKDAHTPSRASTSTMTTLLPPVHIPLSHRRPHRLIVRHVCSYSHAPGYTVPLKLRVAPSLLRITGARKRSVLPPLPPSRASSLGVNSESRGASSATAPARSSHLRSAPSFLPLK